MQTNWEYWRWKQSVVVFLTIGGILSFANSVLAQIVPDNTLGASKSTVQPVSPLVNKIDGGVIRGVNLFHSFQDFNIGQGQSAYFTNPTGITNIFSRVTGNNPSQILGTLGVAGSANLYFLNPNGIIFGPNAKLDISGSFVASTANSIVFPNGMRFSASHPDVPPLLTINVSAPVGLEFEGKQPGAIVNAGNLAVGQNLSLVGGTVVSSGSLSAPNGELAVVTVPGIQADGSTPVVNLGLSGEFVNSEMQSSSISGSSQPVATSVTLAQLLANPVLTNVLTVNANGEAQLNGSNLPVVPGDIVAKNANSQTGIFNAANNLTLVGSTLQTAGDLQLLAQNTVTVRDSVAQPFVAQASGNLLVQGNQGVDISALNNPNSGLFSGGDMVLRSANTVGGDAHYFSGGSFQIEQLDGSPGNLYSPHDPIIRSSGDVSFASYTGASLDIFAGGSVNVSGNITITGVDTAANSITENVTLSDGKTVIPINGNTQPTLDIRAGTTAFGIPGIQGNTTGFSATPTISSIGSSADINIGSITNNGGVVFLTNQYTPNKLLPVGVINVGLIDTSISQSSDGGSITIDARSDITLTGNLDSSSYFSGNGGMINLISGGKIGAQSINSSSLSLENGGNGGTITLMAIGNISAQQVDSSSSSVFGSNGGNGGTINLLSGGNIGAQGIDSSSSSVFGSNGGNGGAITLMASGNILAQQGIYSSSSSFQGNGGNGGAITLMASGNVSAQQGIYSSSTLSFGGYSGNGGAITLKAIGNIDVSSIISYSISGLELNVPQLPISSSSVSGSSLVTEISSNSSPSVSGLSNEGNGGAINLIASGNITVQGIDSSSMGNGGAINLIANGNITVQQINSSSTQQINSSYVGNGGAINLIANGNITVQQIYSYSSTGGIDDGGNGGAINLLASGNIDVQQEIDSSSLVAIGNVGNAGNGGAITLTTLIGNIQTGLLNSFSYSDYGNTGYGGAITLSAKCGEVIGNDNSTVSSSLNSFSVSKDGNAQIGGNITIESKNNITNLDILSISSNSPSGTVELTGFGDLSVTNDSIITSKQITVQLPTALQLPSEITAISDIHTISFNVGEVGQSGNAIITSSGNLIFNNSQIVSSAIGSNPAGNITISSPGLITFNNSQITTNTINTGQGGSVNIQAGQGLSLDSLSSVSTQSSSSGAAGSINIQSPTLTLTGSNLSASNKDGLGGNITITANNFNATNGAQLQTSTTGSAKAGNIILNMLDNITLTGNNTGLFANTTVGSTGAAGVINIDPNTLNILDGAQIDVNSQGTGIGGSIQLTANNLTLNNGKISAETLSNTGGNINMKIQDMLLVRNGSKISTTAGSSQFGGNGGNIDISALFVVGVPIENSDITANAFMGNGGNIQIISTGGIFGLQYRPFLTPYSDITASSSFGENGEVQVATPGIDPSRGLNPLPILPVNTQTLVGCQNGGTQRSVKFFNLGRTGLPSKPDDPLTENIPITDWIDLDSPINEVKRIATKNSQFEASLSKSSTINQPYTIIPPCYAN